MLFFNNANEKCLASANLTFSSETQFDIHDHHTYAFEGLNPFYENIIFKTEMCTLPTSIQ